MLIVEAYPLSRFLAHCKKHGYVPFDASDDGGHIQRVAKCIGHQQYVTGNFPKFTDSTGTYVALRLVKVSAGYGGKGKKNDNMLCGYFLDLVGSEVD